MSELLLNDLIEKAIEQKAHAEMLTNKKVPTIYAAYGASIELGKANLDNLFLNLVEKNICGNVKDFYYLFNAQGQGEPFAKSCSHIFAGVLAENIELTSNSGWSISRFIEDLNKTIAGTPLSPLTFQYLFKDIDQATFVSYHDFYVTSIIKEFLNNPGDGVQFFF